MEYIDKKWNKELLLDIDSNSRTDEDLKSLLENLSKFMSWNWNIKRSKIKMKCGETSNYD